MGATRVLLKPLLGLPPSPKTLMDLSSPPSPRSPAPPPPPPPPPDEVSIIQNDKTTLMHSPSNDSSPTNHEAANHITQQNFSKSSKNCADLLVFINYACLIIGSVSAALLTKFYFIHKGSSRWVSTWIQTAGFPILLLPTFLPYYLFRLTARPPFSGFTTRLTSLSIFVGIFMFGSNFLFSWGTSYLPVSTSSLVLSSQLAFNLVFSVVMVKQKVTFANLNCVILLTLSSVLLALSSSSDRPPGLTRRDYLIGFLATLGAGLTFAVYLPLMEVIFRQVYSYAMVVEMQLITGFVATILATVGMAAGGGFADLRAESAARFDEGTAAYWWTIGGNMVVWQLSFMGTAGMVFLTTSLTGGICMTALMAVNVVAGVVVYSDEFGGVKAVSTAICVWGYCSHRYGMYVKSKKLQDRRKPSVDMNEIIAQS